MNKRIPLSFALAFVALFAVLSVSGCTGGVDDNGAGGNTGALSPSVQDCDSHGGEYNIVTAADGSQSGYCALPDGSNCTDEQYFHGDVSCYNDQMNKQV